MSAILPDVEIEPYAAWNARPWGTPAFRIADIRGCGQADILFVQSAGTHANDAFDPRVNTPGRRTYQTGAEDQDLFCLTLLDASGKLLWRQGQPWSLDRPYSWNGNWERCFEVADISGDGIPEVLIIHRGELRIYSGATGQLIRSRMLPHTGFYSMNIVKTGRTPHYEIFTKSVTNSLTHSYGNPTILLDADLNIVWELDDVPGAGHMGYAGDIDGDGFDELLIGFSLYDHDGSLLWQHQPFSESDHLDNAVMEDLEGQGEWTIALAHDGHDAVIHNVDGGERCRIDMDHCQTVQAARLFDHLPGKQLVFNDKAEGSGLRETVVVDPRGNELSRYQAPGYTSMVNWPTEHGPTSLICMVRPPPRDGRHGVYWMDPTGRVLADLAVRHDFSSHIDALNDIPQNHWAYHGATLTVAVGDIDGDGQDEVLATDRDTVWAFKKPAV